MSGANYSFHRPPGQVDQYQTTLERLLDEVRGESPSKSDLIKWMTTNLGNLSSTNSASRKLSHFEEMGVIRDVSGTIEITDRGIVALEGDSRAVFFRGLLDAYVGFDIIISELAEGPKELDDLQVALENSSYHNWSSSDQHKRRLDWLRSLSIVEEWDNKSGYYVLSADGSDLAREEGLLDYSLDSWDKDVYFVSACGDDVRTNFYESVIEGIDPTAIGIEVEAERLPVWGREDIRLANDPEAGDWLLFYQSGRRNMFTYAAELRSDPIVDSDIGDWIWGGDYEYIYPLQSLTPIDIDSNRLQEGIRGYDRDHVQGMEKLGQGSCEGWYRLQYLYESAEDFVAASARPEYAEVREQLHADGQVILYGPPGTGKTYTTTRFVDWWYAISSERGPQDEIFETTTFHPAYSYEDFIEGLSADADGGAVSYEYEPGVFKTVAETARDGRAEAGDRIPPYLLLVDEINRGNIPQILGELVTQLEWDKREGQSGTVATNLAHSGEADFTVPSNLYLVGTMNTADRSIALLDAAIRRRFSFLRLDPDLQFAANRLGYGQFTGDSSAWTDEAEQKLRQASSLDQRLRAATVLAVAKINDKLLRETDVPRGKRIGHSYILPPARGEGQPTPEELSRIWHHKLFPLLEEFFYNDYRTLEETVFENTTSLFDDDTPSFADLTIEELTESLTHFVMSPRGQASD